MTQTIFFSVGEPSGDQHAARLIRELLRRDGGLSVRGFGGPEMAAASCAIDLELTSHAVVGLLEVLPKLREFFGFADQAEAIFAAGGVDAVVLVDFPGFNWHIAKRAKKYGIPVFYYCPPQLWAWGGWRVKKMKASVDHVLAVLPIEQDYFSAHGIPTTFVGHPFFDAVASSDLDPDKLAGATEDQSSQIVAVLPGSRTHEVHNNWPVMLAAIRRLSRTHPDVRFAVAAYREKHRDHCLGALEPSDASLPIDSYVGATSEIIEAADCAMMVSGSVSLELMARRTPAAVIYRVGRFLYAYAKCVVKVDSLTLPNLMWDRECGSNDREGRPYPEIVSVGNPEPAIGFLTEQVGRLLEDADHRAAKISRLDQLRDKYAQTGASGRAAEKLIELVQGAAPTAGDTASRAA